MWDAMWRVLAASLETARSVLRKESLPAPPPKRDSGARRGLANLLFAIEPLPLAPELSRERTHWLRWLFLPERLDRQEERPTQGP